MLTWEGTPFQGAENIVEKLTVGKIDRVRYEDPFLNFEIAELAIPKNRTQSGHMRCATFISEYCKSDCWCDGPAHCMLFVLFITPIDAFLSGR